MIVKIKTGAPLTINGKKYRVGQTTLENCERNGTSTKVSMRLTSENHETLNIQFDKWTTGISEKDLDGLQLLLSRG